jgi:hypothetical protein
MTCLELCGANDLLTLNGQEGFFMPGRVLKKSPSSVLASLRGSTYGTEYASPLLSLRPCWTVFLTTLRAVLMASAIPGKVAFLGCRVCVSTTC